MKFTEWRAGNFRYHVVFSKSILFTLGLVFSYKLVQKLFFNILINYLIDAWKLWKAIVVNLQEGIRAVAVVLFSFMADAYSGLLTVVVCSTILYIIGLFLTYYAAQDGDQSLDLVVFYPSLVLMTLSHAAESFTLEAFLGDQVVARDRPATQEEEERAQSRGNFWWYFVFSLAAVFALVIGSLWNVSSWILAMVLGITMGAAFLWFLLGIKFYTCVNQLAAHSVTLDMSSVVQSLREMLNIHRIQSSYPKNLVVLCKLSHVSWLRWLDRAAVVQESPAGQVCSVEQVKEVKFLLKMLPMSTTCLTFSLVAASGSTFFLQQAASLSEDIFPILVFTILQRFTQFMVSVISMYMKSLVRKRETLHKG